MEKLELPANPAITTKEAFGWGFAFGQVFNSLPLKGMAHRANMEGATMARVIDGDVNNVEYEPINEQTIGSAFFCLAKVARMHLEHGTDPAEMHPIAGLKMKKEGDAILIYFLDEPRPIEIRDADKGTAYP